ncbi:MAG: tryptophan synthase subunit alpha [Acidobacteriota bacterium]|nr:tryptophan synthase subunit alpha [Acidobacteriota bacterium]
MGKIGEKFKALLSQRKKALIPFFTAFYPTQELFREFILRADDVGVDFIEVGIPFSDPLADGKMIQYSSQWSLNKKFSFSLFLEEIAILKKNLNSSLILMSYFNPILQRGIECFGREMKEASIEGVIVPDLPLEESFYLKDVLSSYNIDLIYLISPNTSPKRIRKISNHSQGFIYLVSLTGVTGMREKLPDNLYIYIRKVREITSKPLCLGFGISNPYQAMRAAELSDGVIVGSALINILKGREQEKYISRDMGDFLKELRKVI